MLVQIDSALLDEIRARLRSLDPNAGVTPKIFEDAYREFLVRHASTLRSPNTLRDHFPVLLPHFGGRPVHEITLGDCQAFIAARIAQGKRPATINRNRSGLMRFLGWCVENRYAASNVATKIKRLREPGGRTRTITPQEFDQLLDAARRSSARYLAPFLFCAVYTGMRRGELMRLRWSDYDVANALIRVRAATTKSLRERVIPVVGELADVLQDWRVEQAALGGDLQHVFTYRGKPIKDIGSFTRLCARLGIHDLHLHDARHSFASAFVNSGGSIFSLQHILGHSESKTTGRYAHAAQSFLVASAQHIGMPGRPRLPRAVVEPPKPLEPPIPIPAATIQLLRDVRDLLGARPYITTHEILGTLSARPGYYMLAGPVMATCRVLAGMLRPVGVKPSQVGQDDGVNRKGYRRARLAVAFARYLND